VRTCRASTHEDPTIYHSLYLQVLDDIDHLPGGVRVGDGAVVGHGAQLSKGGHQLLEGGVRHLGPVLLQHGQLRLGLRVVHGVAAEDVP